MRKDEEEGVEKRRQDKEDRRKYKKREKEKMKKKQEKMRRRKSHQYINLTLMKLSLLESFSLLFNGNIHIFQYSKEMALKYLNIYF